ncbi:16S rRNA (cytosine(1402)-N(4))-methyltransferase RsmH [Halosquirtibacter xylanolyticus]|uniref:16S rRNA (cytosine(1402)-N(4))-methyltransferase RsmH n=1 Tax=Halosquirtibacter xylanolyticus TaxID=3374599 RepID=UPI003749877C|nr:16S rRNA (cytosine(1402)-N(4))-methyltransferase RsmH [Prolixibacteraceae bacterium]
MSEYHVPVLLDECIEGLDLKEGGIYVDVTFGGGGHSREILKKLVGGKLVGFDQDIDAKANVPDDDRFIFVNHNFKYIQNFLAYYGIDKVDGILADLGVSSHEFDVAERGFSFRFDGNLDMRMNQSGQTSAAEIVNSYSEQELSRLFWRYGEVKNSRKLARIIVEERENNPIETIQQFKEMIASCTPKHIEHKYLAKVFQALRIEVNQEMEVLEALMNASQNVLKPGGRLVVITYHSLEDRIVKNMIKEGKTEGKAEKDFFGKTFNPFKAINRKVILPTEEEQKINPRSRSAKLRIAERVEL